MKHAGEDETGICRLALQRVSHHAARHGDDWLRFLDGTARVACCPRWRGSPPAVQQHSVVTTCSLGSRSSADRITIDCCRLGNQVSHATWRGVQQQKDRAAYVLKIIASVCFYYIVGPLQWMVITHLETSQTLATVVSDQIVKDLISRRTTLVLKRKEEAASWVLVGLIMGL